MPSDLTRRRMIAGMGAAMAVAILPRGAAALNTQEASGLISSLVGEINTVINSGKSEGAMYADFERIFVRYADVATIARFVLGPTARSLNSAQFASYQRAFQGYIARKYGRRFREFIGGRITVRGAQPVKGNYLVTGTADLRGEQPFDVSFLVSDRSGRTLFVDMMIEGVSLLKSEAVEVRAMLDRAGGSVDRLTAALGKAG